MKRVLTVLTLLASINVNASGIPTVDILGNIQTALQYIDDVSQTMNQADQIANEVQGLYNQTEQIANQLKALENLGSYNWQDYLNILTNLETVAAKADALAFTVSGGLDSEYAQYRDQAYYEANTKLYDQQQAAQARWSAQASGTAKSSAAVLSAQYEDLKDDGTELNVLQNSSESLNGEVQAIQAGNQLAAFTSKQLMQVRTLLMNQQQMMIQERAQTAEREALQAAATMKATAPSAFVPVTHTSGW